MIERLLIAGLVVMSVILVARLVRLWDRRRCARLAANRTFAIDQDDLPQIVTFVGQHCPACDRQKHINSELSTNRPSAATVRYVDAVSEASLALSYGVIVVPTTLIISSSGRVVSMTSGVLSGDQLTQHLAAAR